MKTWHSKSDTETMNIGCEIAAKLHGGDVVLLYGELGAGKTTLTKGIARYFGIKKNITSPTFALMNIYRFPKEKNGASLLAHIDTYRMKDEKEFASIGGHEIISDKKTISIIEWPEKMFATVAGKMKCIKKIVVVHENHRTNIRKIQTCTA